MAKSGSQSIIGTIYDNLPYAEVTFVGGPHNPMAYSPDAIPVEGISVSPSTSTKSNASAFSQQLTLTWDPVDATTQLVTYSISPTIAGLTVSDSGLIEGTTAVTEGDYTITATTQDGAFTDTCVLTVS